MKILVISESINVNDSSSASKVNVALISNLKKAGFNLKVLHYSHKKIDIEGIECVWIKENRMSILFFLSRFVRLFQRHSKILINHRLENIFGFSFTHSNDTNQIAKIIKKECSYNPDLILTLSKGGSFRPHRAMLKLPKLQQKWMAYIHDPYPFHMYPRPFNWVEYGYRHKEKFMREITEKSKFLAFPSLLLKQWMESYFPAVEHKSEVIPHQINASFQPESVIDFFKENEFSLLHAGNLLKQRNPEFLLKAYLNFLKNNPEAIENSTLYLIGNNDSHKKLLKQYKNHPNICIKNYIEYNLVQTLENNVAVNIILEAVSEISPFLPGKFPNCVVANKPILILGPYYSEVKRLLGNNYPYWSEANDEKSIESIITSLYLTWKNNPSSLKLNRKDLVDYSTELYLKNVMENLK
jgi:glycosyltransferase involved in cell wall biosynthesis